jgi:transposase
LDAIVQQVRQCYRQLSKRSKAYPIVGSWQALPGVGLIRSATLLAYLDTPWRFPNRNKLCKYCGVGIERTSSGKDRFGQPKPGLLQLAWQVNRRLKNAVMGATITAINQGHNPFAARYEELLHYGLTASNARHTVARRLVTVMWGMWKSNQPYDPEMV